MWAAMFSRKPAAQPADGLEVRAIEVTSDPSFEGKLETEPETRTKIKTEGTASPEIKPTTLKPTVANGANGANNAGPKPNGANGVNPALAKPTERPTTSSKRPRSSSGISEGTTSPLRKRSRPSLPRQSTPSSQHISTLRSPLVRSRRISDGPTARIKDSPLKAEVKVETLSEDGSQLQTTGTSVTESITESLTIPVSALSILPVGDVAPKSKRRSRLSLPPPEPERPFREPSVTSITTEQDTEEFNELMRDGFSWHEAALFQHIRKRGLEPIMPAHWQVDFATMPDNLFTGAEEQAYIEAITLDGTFNATAAFQALVNLGAGVRGKLETDQDVESRILMNLRKYIQWSIDDAKLGGKHIQPLIAISSSQEKGAEHCEQRMDKKLRDLAVEFQVEESRLLATGCSHNPEAPSTVYGLAVAGCVVALITLDARNSGAPTRTLLVVDFSDVTLDFWNAVGIALLVISARDDELERIDFYEENNMERPEKAEGAHAWQGKMKVRRQSDDSDEDA